MKSQPIVSVCMITYGHEKYIEQAIEGVLMQQCDFEIELIVANDCSPDNTDLVVEKILKTHPKASSVNYIKQEKNIGMMPNFISTLKKCTGKYIALCEGDDYWTDPLKLQKQVDFLEANEEYVLCFHKIKVLRPDATLVDDFITTVPEHYKTQETLARLGNYIHTPSVVFRNIIKVFPHEFSLSPIGDYFLYIMLTNFGKVKMLNDTMAVYRYGVGVFSALSNVNHIRANIKLFALLMSFNTDDNLNKIFYQRHLDSIDYLENTLKTQFPNKVSVSIFTRVFNLMKHPKQSLVKIKNKLNL
jgi:glycosyltransferase involved in cell wall biosynthesis